MKTWVFCLVTLPLSRVDFRSVAEESLLGGIAAALAVRSPTFGGKVRAQFSYACISCRPFDINTKRRLETSEPKYPLSQRPIPEQRSDRCHGYHCCQCCYGFCCGLFTTVTFVTWVTVFCYSFTISNRKMQRSLSWLPLLSMFLWFLLLPVYHRYLRYLGYRFLL